MNISKPNTEKKNKFQKSYSEIFETKLPIEQIIKYDNYILCSTRKQVIKINLEDKNHQTPNNKIVLSIDDGYHGDFIIKQIICVEDYMYILITNKKYHSKIYKYNILTEKTPSDNKIECQQIIKEIKIHCREPNILILLTQGSIYKCDLDKTKNFNRIPLSPKNLPRLRSRKELKDFSRKKDIKENNLITLYSSPKYILKAFDFDIDMEYLYINDEKMIKKIEIDSELIKITFEGHTSDIKDIVLSEDKEKLYR